MTKLLVSVRTAAEALIAHRNGADIVDIKEPTRGSLGAADAGTIQNIADALAGRATLSVALGELLSDDPPQLNALIGISYAKFGLAGCAACPGWSARWQARIERLPAGAAAVAVVYADAVAQSPCWEEVLAAAQAANVPVLLVDTHHKTAGSLLAHWTLANIARMVEQVQRAGLEVALAGSLDITAIEQLLPIQPDFVGVRGAVCHGGRTGTLDGANVQRLAELVQCRQLQPESI